jgi:putative endopeptidase
MKNNKEVRIQDDLYLAVNGKWLETAVIPDDRPTAGGFAELDQGVERKLMADFKAFAEGEKTSDIPEMKEAIALYKKILDVARRNKEGLEPALPVLHEIANIKTVADLNKKAKELTLMNVDLPVNFGVEPDMQDATKNSFVVLGPDIILPDTTYYDDKNLAKEKLLGVWSDVASKLLAMTDLSEEDQKQYLADTLAFDALVATKVKSQVEWSVYVNNYNPMPVEEVAKFVAPFDFIGLLNEFYGAEAPKQVIVYDPKAIKELNGYFSEEKFNLYIHWAYVKCLMKSTSTLSEEIAALGTTYRRTLTGVAKDPVLEKKAYQTVSKVFSEPVGVYYGRTYFGEEAKKDVVDMCKKIIDMYKVRMANNTFLEENTKKKAILKLDKIEIKMGYPDKIDEYYSKLTVAPADSLFMTMAKINKIGILHNLEKLNKPVDRTEWGMPGHLVNACYNPSSNDITFPAAILQKPFYGLDQSVSENLGGIGAVIGHEISHAFDNNGAAFDENGNLFNWWTEKDFAAFKKLTQRMIEEFDGIEYYGGKVNGELIVSENIADNGGVGVTLGIMHTLKNPDYQAFFKTWGRIWCMKAKENYIRLLLTTDVHAPAQLRANMQPRNFAEWYEAFDVKETDQMYLAPEKRITIW